MTIGTIIKPGDLVRTPSGRSAEVREILPNHERRVVFLDGRREGAEFRTSLLTLVQASTPRPWIRGTPD